MQVRYGAGKGGAAAVETQIEGRGGRAGCGRLRGRVAEGGGQGEGRGYVGGGRAGEKQGDAGVAEHLRKQQQKESAALREGAHIGDDEPERDRTPSGEAQDHLQ